jgi:peptidoglycan L-alanyl-D-glutamate endopeptidase CwlK
MSLSDEQAKFLLDACKLIEYATKKGWTVTGGEMYRTQAQQEIYFKEGKTKTLQSNHMRRLAIDLNFLKDGKPVWDKSQLADVGKFWESLNSFNRWGGNFKSLPDTPHFERNVG